jgi:hypothetical protein
MTGRERTPGWISVRVRWGKVDLKEVVRSLRDRPWFHELRYLGIQAPYYLFERPDPKIAAEQRKASVNPLASLEAFRVR